METDKLEEDCDHKDEFGNYTFETEDDTVTTDRGTMGGIGHWCTQCDEDISDEVEYYMNGDWRED